MSTMLADLAQAIFSSPAHDWAIQTLRTVPGLPPILQTFHILSITAIMASAVLINLRILGWAVPGQDLSEMRRRLMPWTWYALPVLLLTGSMFILARPHRYFLNPVFGFKVAILVLAIGLTLYIARAIKPPRFAGVNALTLKAVAGISLLSWLLIVLAGRWIAYSDYLFPPV